MLDFFGGGVSLNMNKNILKALALSALTIAAVKFLPQDLKAQVTSAVDDKAKIIGKADQTADKEDVAFFREMSKLNQDIALDKFLLEGNYQGEEKVMKDIQERLKKNQERYEANREKIKQLYVKYGGNNMPLIKEGGHSNIEIPDK